MRLLALLAVSAALFAPSVNLSASTRYIKVGDFDIDALDNRNNFILDDGNTYKPTSEYQRDKTIAWQLGDSIMILKAKGKNRFVLVNTRTGQKATMKAVRMD